MGWDSVDWPGDKSYVLGRPGLETRPTGRQVGLLGCDTDVQRFHARADFVSQARLIWVAKTFGNSLFGFGRRAHFGQLGIDRRECVPSFIGGGGAAVSSALLTVTLFMPGATLAKNLPSAPVAALDIDEPFSVKKPTVACPNGLPSISTVPVIETLLRSPPQPATARIDRTIKNLRIEPIILFSNHQALVRHP